MKDFCRPALILCLLGLTLGLRLSRAAEEAPLPPSKAIQDNSFLIEEAYNQEPGVVQHIVTADWRVNNRRGSDDHEWRLAFTQEWPVFSQKHQFAYNVPYSFARHDGDSVDGLGDVALNYRFQALFEADRRPAFAPSFSLILPTGDEKKGLGDDTVGYRLNLPVSKVISDRWTLHGNAGVTFQPNLQDQDPVSWNLGGSVIYALNDRLNLMLEGIGEWNEGVDGGRIEREFQAILSPGARYAFNFSESQLVVGAAAPIGLNGDAPDYGVFLYLSFEHSFLK